MKEITQYLESKLKEAQDALRESERERARLESKLTSASFNDVRNYMNILRLRGIAFISIDKDQNALRDLINDEVDPLNSDCYDIFPYHYIRMLDNLALSDHAKSTLKQCLCKEIGYSTECQSH